MIESVSNASFAFSGYGQSSSYSRFERAGGSQLDIRETEQSRSLASSEKESTQTQGNRENDLTDSEKEQVEELKKRDAAVRAHEQAHLAAAGSLAMGGANYVYQTGPDGKQ